MGYAGLIYWLIGPVSAVIGYKRGNARLRVEGTPASSPAEQAASSPLVS
jgi:hypothetical protein